MTANSIIEKHSSINDIKSHFSELNEQFILENIDYINHFVALLYRVWMIEEWLSLWNILLKLTNPETYKKINHTSLYAIAYKIKDEISCILRSYENWLIYKVRVKTPFSIFKKIWNKIDLPNSHAWEINCCIDDLIWIKILVDSEYFENGFCEFFENEVVWKAFWIKLKYNFLLSKKILPPKIPAMNYSWNYYSQPFQIKIVDASFENPLHASTYFIHKWFNIDNISYNSPKELYIRIVYFYIIEKILGENYQDHLFKEVKNKRFIHNEDENIQLVYDYLEKDKLIKGLYHVLLEW